MEKTQILLGDFNKSILIPTAKAMWKQEGMRVFFRGLLPALVGVFPFAAIDLSVFESLKHSSNNTDSIFVEVFWEFVGSGFSN
ncbi:hypothetical protein K7432_017720 [Basidiobolus ranarum]|uniref:Uncharacterized protein n=1 Tax=Basidiobolus ranarum TaxID=34480 RepID=A0ABR2WD00_9FUNG